MFSSSVGDLSVFLYCLCYNFRGRSSTLTMERKGEKIRLAFFYVLSVHIIFLNAAIIDHSYTRVVMDLRSQNTRY